MTSRIKLALGIAGALLFAAVAVNRFFFRAQEVVVAKATSAAVATSIHGPGTVEPRYPVVVGARLTAVVTSLFVDQGDSVRRGQLLARLDDRDLTARASGARTELALARANHGRDAEVFAKGYISQASMDAATAALRSAEAHEQETAVALSYTRITAPVDGIVTARQVEVGQPVAPGSAMFRIADPRTLWVATRVDETVVGRVKVGQAATIELRTGERLAGRVARVGLESDVATRELEVNVAFETPPTRFAVNQEAEVTIHLGEERGVTVPVTGVVRHGQHVGVLLVMHGRAVFRPVTVGATDGERVVIREGVKAGEQVVRQPDNLKPGSRLAALQAPGM